MTVSSYTPPALAHLADPPTFRLREPSRADREAYAAEVRRAGATVPGPDEFRAEAERGLRQVWHYGIADAALARLRGMWARIDAGEPLDPVEAAELEGLGFRLEGAWPAFRALAQTKRQVEVEVPRRALARLLIGWRNVAVPFRRPVTLALVDELATALPGRAFLQLTGEAVTRIGKTSP